MKNLHEEVNRSKELMGLNNSEFSSMVMESAIEVGINVNNIIRKEQKLLREGERKLITEAGITLGIIGTALASGKLLDLIGVLIRKAHNLLVKWKWINGKEWDKTKLEQAGKWIDANIIKKFFQVIARSILTPISYFAGTIASIIDPKSSNNVSNQVLNQTTINTLANVLFYGSLAYVGMMGFKVALPSLATGAFMPILEFINSSIKGYELIWLIVAVVLTNIIEKFKEYKSQVSSLAHSLMNCFEGESRNPLKAMKLIKKDNQKYVTCVIGHMGGNEEKVTQEPEQDNQEPTEQQPVEQQ